MDKGCNFFKWLDDETADERDLKIERKKKRKIWNWWGCLHKMMVENVNGG